MSQKGLYKKTIGSGWDHSPDSQRPREKRFFEKAENGQPLERLFCFFKEKVFRKISDFLPFYDKIYACKRDKMWI